ncbi:prepilin-type N-terminal cleavage/methylation domain-containing protein [Lachnotalea glycerini]|nr:prepilin-type N-terminal cleavage/methylation domain-containing protein [Lachnotalea glycerini]PXV93318.1 prepilin-type N-terminal cleavage/methylation domain-containing protein [Lachnotalea glycerini]
MENNKGLSLIELIVVIAIIAILSAGTVISIGLIFQSDVKECSHKLAGYIGQAKITTMSKVSGDLELYQDASDKDYYVTISSETTPYKIGNSGLTITCVTTLGNEIVISNTNTLKLKFDRSSGAFKYLEGTTDYCNQIKIQKKTKEISIYLIPETGKYYID